MSKADKAIEKSIGKQITNMAIHHPLLKSLRDNDKKNLFTTNTTTHFHKTGFPIVDFYLGAVINIYDATGAIEAQEPRLGQAAGTFNVVCSKSGAGKTTLVSQIAANIIRPHPLGSVHHYDFEQRMLITRLANITKLPIKDFDDDGRYILKQGAITLEELQEAIVKLYAEKMRNREMLTINTGERNEFGREVKVLAPSVFIIDSISQVITSSFSVDNAKDVADAEKLRGNTEGARDAKTLRGFFRDIAPLCKEANIIIFAINHITANMSMNAFTGPTKQQMFLKQDEAIPGGTAQFFASFNFLKMVAQTADDFTETSDGFNGHVVMVEPLKCSSNQSGNDSKGVSFELIFDFATGFDSLRSLIHYGRQKGLIEGTKTRLKFKDEPGVSFVWKDLDKEKNEKPIWECIGKYVVPALKEHLSFVEPDTATFDERSMQY